MNSRLIAPCGMNCSICMAYLREKNKCPGCRGSDINKQKSVLKCRIKNCNERNNSGFCFSCDIFPCAKLKHLDKRYRTKYAMSMIENLEDIKKSGIRKFVIMEKNKWIREDKIFCVHNKEYHTLKK